MAIVVGILNSYSGHPSSNLAEVGYFLELVVWELIKNGFFEKEPAQMTGNICVLVVAVGAKEGHGAWNICLFS